MGVGNDIGTFTYHSGTFWHVLPWPREAFRASARHFKKLLICPEARFTYHVLAFYLSFRYQCESGLGELGNQRLTA